MEKSSAWRIGMLATSLVLGGHVRVAADTPEGRSSRSTPSQGSSEEKGTVNKPAAAPAEAEEGQTAAPPETSKPNPAPPGTISVDFKDADIRQVLRIISLKSGVDIVASPDVEGVVSIKLTSVPWEQALDIILRTYGLTYERKANVIRVMTAAAVEQEALATEVFPLNYAQAKDVISVIKEMLTERGKVKFDERTNTVIVTDIPSNVFQTQQVIQRLDRSTPQIHIESRFVETRLSRDENLGIDWFDSMQLTLNPATAPTTLPFPAGNTLGRVGKNFLPRPGTFSPATGASLPEGRIPEVGGQFTFGTITMAQMVTTLNMLKQRIDTHVISNPTIVTLNNKQANIQVGTDVNIPNFQVDPSTGRATVTGFQTRSTGIILKVTPYVNPNEEIVLDVNPEITSVGSDRTFAQGITFPDFDVQKAQTQVRLKDQETLAIGGLKRQAERVTNDKVPFLGDLPLVGWLFTHRREQTPSGQDQLDLLIFLTVHLIKEPPTQQHAAVAAQPAGR